VKRLLLALFVIVSAGPSTWAFPIWADTPGQTLYARIRTGATTSVAVAFTEGTSNAVGYYSIADASVLSAGLSTAGDYTFKVFVGTPSTSAADTQIGSGSFAWNGSIEIPQTANTTFFGGSAGTFSSGRPEVTLTWNSTWDTEVQSEVDDALRALELDHLLLTDTPTTVPGSGILNDLLEWDATPSLWRFRANALEQAPSGGPGGGGMTVEEHDWLEAIFNKLPSGGIMGAGIDYPTGDELGEIAEEILTAVENIDIIGDLTPVAPTSIADSRTWFVNADGWKAGNIVTVKAPFAGTLAANGELNDDFDIDRDGAITVTITDPVDDPVVATDFTVTGDGRTLHFDVPELTITGNYAVLVTLETLDGQTVSLECKLVVR
jgi:hypothetical protein